MAAPQKDFVIKKFSDPSEPEMMVARLHKMWSDECNNSIEIDFSAYQGLELFWEQAPMVEEEDEKAKELILENEALTKLDGKIRRITRGVREPRWVLRDNVRKKAERNLRKEAEEKGKPPPHDARLANIKQGGLLMLGSKEGVLTAAADHDASKKTMTDDSGNARYAIMVQTGDDEVSIANLGNWLTFRAPQLKGGQASNSTSLSRPRKHLSSRQQRVMTMVQKDEEKNLLEAQKYDAFKPTKARGSRKKTARSEGGQGDYDGYEEEDTGAAGTYSNAEFLDGMQADGDEEAPDNEDRVRSDDEAGSDGRDDMCTEDVNNAQLDSSEEEESDIEEDEEIDDEKQKKLDKILAKLKAAQKNSMSCQDESDDSDVEEDKPVASRSLQYLGLDKKTDESKKRGRAEEDLDGGNVKKRGAGSETSAAHAITSNYSSSSSSSSSFSVSTGISESEVRALLDQYNGRMKTKDLRKFFKARIKASESAKLDLIAILKHLVVKQTDEVEGEMYVLKARQYG